MVTLDLVVDMLYGVEDDQLMQPTSEPPETTRSPQTNQPKLLSMVAPSARSVHSSSLFCATAYLRFIRNHQLLAFA